MEYTVYWSIHTMYIVWIQLRVVYIFWSKLALKATINTISITGIPLQSWFIFLEEKEYLDKTTWPAEVMDNLYHIQLYRVHLAIHWEVGLLKQNHRQVARTPKTLFQLHVPRDCGHGNRDFDNEISWHQRNKIIMASLVGKNRWLSVHLRGNFGGYILPVMLWIIGCEKCTEELKDHVVLHHLFFIIPKPICLSSSNFHHNSTFLLMP